MPQQDSPPDNQPDSQPDSRQLPVVVVGAGPVGLATASHLLAHGLQPLVLEAGDRAAPAVRQWSHVRLVAAWSELVDRAAADLLTATGWTAPHRDVHPTGREWAEWYLQ